MGFEQPYIYYFLFNLLFIFSSLVFGVLRIFQIYSTSRKDINIIYPAHKWAIALVMVYIFQFPYTINVFSESAFIYTVVFDCIIFLPLSILCWERYFYIEPIKTSRKLFVLLLPVSFLVILFFSVLIGSSFIERNKIFIISIGKIIFVVELMQSCYYILRTYLFEIKKFKMEYSNEDDFPVSKAFAMIVILVICITFFIPEIFILQRDYKMFKDCVSIVILFFISITWMFVYKRREISEVSLENIVNTANSAVDIETNVVMGAINGLKEAFGSTNVSPKKITELNQAINTNAKESKNELIEKIKNVIEKNDLYKNPNFSMNDLLTFLPTNRTYLSNALAQSEEGSFYRMVLKLRVNFAKELLVDDQFMRIEEVAKKSGFTSQSFFSRSFKQEVGLTPTQFRNNNLI
ncbi:MAG: AraC family transcriptional regulator [Bacteroidales bacterium]|nr:AraC family transcriptional regulator [Bacteroidales bacterium]